MPEALGFLRHILSTLVGRKVKHEVVAVVVDESRPSRERGKRRQLSQRDFEPIMATDTHTHTHTIRGKI